MKLISTIFLSILFFLNINAQALFTDNSEQAGVNSMGRTYGVAFGDYNNDGYDDIYLSRHAMPNILYMNMGDGTFQDKAETAGVDHIGTTTTSVWADIDNDNDLDLYLGNRDEPNILYRNNGNGTFTDISEEAGVNDNHRTRSIMFADIDMDGLVDLYVANMLAPNYLYRNNGDNTFSDITSSSGTSDNQIAMGAMFFDYDNDGDPDLYLTHDANQANILYRNNGNLTFTDVSMEAGVNYSGFGMGTDFGDVNNDGFLDIYITNLYENILYLNNDDGTFTDISEESGTTDIGMGWGTSWLDYNNDGLQDIYAVNDSYFSPRPNILYQNMGNNTFSIQSENSPLMAMYGSYGTACADLNEDGFVDIFLVNAGNSDYNQLFLNNNQNDNNWVKIRARGKTSNAAAIGARIEVEANDQLHIDEVTSGTGYASQNSLTLHFGLGQAEIIDKIEVKWPSGQIDIFEEVAVNQSYTVTEGEQMVTSAKEQALAEQIQISVPYPNPFSDKVILPINLEASTNLEVSVLNLLGQRVSILAAGNFSPGLHQIEWDGSTKSNGIYLIQIKTASGSIAKKVNLLR